MGNFFEDIADSVKYFCSLRRPARKLERRIKDNIDSGNFAVMHDLLRVNLGLDDKLNKGDKK